MSILKETTMFKWLTCLIVCLCVTTVYAKPLTLSEVSFACCKVNSGNAVGSGAFIGEDDSKYIVLTNGHVAQAQNVSVEVYVKGVKSDRIPAKLEWRAFQDRTTVDFATISVSKEYFKDYKPTVVALVPREYQPEVGFYVYTAGVPEGNWLYVCEGQIQRIEGNQIKFLPPPLSGQSGSPLFVLLQSKSGEWFTRVGGIVTWRIKDQGGFIGGGISTQELYNALDGNIKGNYINASYQYLQYQNESLRDWFRKPTPPQNPQNPPNNGPFGNILPNQPFPNIPRPQQPILPGLNPPQQNPITPQVPRLGAPWPGEEKPPQLGQLGQPGVQPPLSNSLSSQIAQLEKDKQLADLRIKELEAKLKTPESSIKTAIVNNPVLTGFFGAIGLGLLYFVWRKFGRSFVAKKLDSIEDLLQSKVEAKWGKEAADQAREVMESGESILLNLVDTFLEQRKLVAKAQKAGNPSPIPNTPGAQLIAAITKTVEEENKKALAQSFSRDELLALVELSQKTEQAEGDTVQVQLLEELKARIVKLENLSPQEGKEIIEKVAEHEKKEQDTEVLAKLKELENKLSQLQK